MDRYVRGRAKSTRGKRMLEGEGYRNGTKESTQTSQSTRVTLVFAIKLL